MKKISSFADNPVIGGVVKKAISSLASKDAKNISEHFSHYLQPTIANSHALREEVYRLRHQVYCEELQFEQTNSVHQEKDDFDEHAIHCFVRHLSSKQLAGTVRLIYSRQPEELLPIEKYCAHAITDKHIFPGRFAREEICEISRLAVPAAFRKRAVDNFAGAATGAIDHTTFSATELRCFPYIAICLYMSAAAMSYKTKRYYGFVMMEPRLAKSLSYVGIKFHQLGDAVEYHGLRAAYFIDSRELRKTLSGGYQSLLKSVEHELFGELSEEMLLEPNERLLGWSL
ncbi:PEP-CTERM/exosortase system-associated acyltransferase [Rheinheimera sp. UJ51]|uniref:PEP-CTERM/exosortase system-associated acyltransferase n=1 Tax=Rheinheimera sp. UJ51 TaxID=2892446 RepID=UPI001E28EB9D|nr:PEP-CTERM/exosortase system-associated acyltransferase [Rheinheimera sp. UJ51]MCC5451111.1 PEP-CTERM/exosortase system-associated acyltransferase [Rheinheimera sp. UJ51]